MRREASQPGTPPGRGGAPVYGSRPAAARRRSVPIRKNAPVINSAIAPDNGNGLRARRPRDPRVRRRVHHLVAATGEVRGSARSSGLICGGATRGNARSSGLICRRSYARKSSIVRAHARLRCSDRRHARKRAVVRGYPGLRCARPASCVEAPDRPGSLPAAQPVRMPGRRRQHRPPAATSPRAKARSSGLVDCTIGVVAAVETLPAQPRHSPHHRRLRSRRQPERALSPASRVPRRRRPPCPRASRSKVRTMSSPCASLSAARGRCAPTSPRRSESRPPRRRKSE